MDDKALKLAIEYMLEDLKVMEGDAEIFVEDEEQIALIPYYSHGRMCSHKIPLEQMAKSVHSALITTNQ